MSVAANVKKHREAIYAGIFYPDDADMLNGLLSSAITDLPRSDQQAAALLVPHASVDYIIGLQAKAWQAASKESARIKTIVILADQTENHETPAVIVPESCYFDTPIGQVQIARHICREIESSSTMVQVDDIGHMKEHSIEVQLPFIKKLFPDAKLVPIILRGKHANIAKLAARILDLVFPDDCRHTLFVASANIGASLLPQKAKQQADIVLRHIVEGNLQGLFNHKIEYTSISVNSIATLMELNALKQRRFQLLGQADSQAFRDNNAEAIVQYAAGAWF